ncbi:pancortin-3 [Aliivibrio fischeri]|uniref:Cap15 family cyclic dinucleotide receptor domain-containing protein n=1 Tax=Aliivibrio fischeri TaxID=668 RepID=UPI0012DA4CB3|nr:pancortin-3 [Aliivibrio fischeri]MUK71467.1 pancortin-3 [Aliivibrio fischeri]MUK75264.1 pancortin-3 [Aliivibrio fischeri]
MHDYAIFGHDRASIGRWLGFISILAAGGLAQLGILLSNITGWEAFTKGSVTVGVAYFGFHWFFNRWIWKIPFFNIPNLNGVWSVKGRTLDENGNSKYEWPAELGIQQDWKQISINIKTEKSQSQSYTATLMKRNGVRGGWILSYSYKNEPSLQQIHELNAHKGYCEIEFDQKLGDGEGTYFNSGGRKTYGLMSIVRVKDD